jgi:hypothetical protein
LAADFDPFSAAKLILPVEELVDSPTPFPCVASLEKGTWIYRLTTERGRSLGSTTARLSNDLMEIVRSKYGRGRSPDRIDHIFVLGFASAVAEPGDDRLKGAKGRAERSGFWIVPQISGLPLVFFPWR